jgi:hypothetical protein
LENTTVSQFLKINDKHWINVNSIREIRFDDTGTAANSCRIYLNDQGSTPMPAAADIVRNFLRDHSAAVIVKKFLKEHTPSSEGDADLLDR